MRRLGWALGIVIPLAGCGSSGASGSGDSPFGGSGGSLNAGGSTAGGSSNAGSSSGGSTNNPQGGSSSGGNTNGGSSSGGSSAGGSSTGGSGTITDAGLADVNFEYDAPIYTPEACAGESIQAEPIPVDMYIVLDDSGSMGSSNTCASNPRSDKWCNSVTALTGFFASSEASGTGIALNYFNNRSTSTCNGTGLQAPHVALNTLPAHISALETSLRSTVYPGYWNHGTPTPGAMVGIADFTTANRRAGRQMVGVLITDGAPSCTSPDIKTAANNLFSNHGIPTFMVGMTGATFANLETWAVGSGAPSHSTNCGNGASSCYHYSVGNGDPAVFISVLKEIQKAAVGCTFNVPTPSSGVLDPNTVIVTYTPNGTGSPQTLTRVPNEAACSGPGTGEFYFDNNTTPTQIRLCPSLCTTVSADANAEIDVEIGCLGS